MIYGTREKPAAIFLITSKCFITVSVGMVWAIRCHLLNMKTNSINGSEVSELSVAIQTSCFLEMSAPCHKQMLLTSVCINKKQVISKKL